MQDLESLTLGAVFDVFTEYANDSCEYAKLATQDDFDKF